MKKQREKPANTSPKTGKVLVLKPGSAKVRMVKMGKDGCCNYR